MKNFYLKYLISPMIILSLASCEVAKAPEENTTHGVVIGYFFLDESAIDPQYLLDPADPNSKVRDLLSTIFGKVAVATLDSTFQKAFLPKMGCYKGEDAPDATYTATKPLDPGTIFISNDIGNSFSIPKYEGPLFFARGFLDPGTYHLQSTGINGALSFDEKLSVPQAGSNIKITSGSHVDQAIPSPLINTGIIIHIARTSGASISFTPAPDADFVKVHLHDFSQNNADIICYGPKDSPIVIPASLTASFPVSETGAFELSFIKTVLDKGLARYNEVFISSSLTHVHGIQPLNSQQALQFGKISFE